MSEYSRVDKRRQTYPSTDRFRYRDIAPCVVWKGLVYCAPPDAAELFALDATTGDLVWSSDAGQSADLNHILGVTDQYLIAGGDHLVWFDRSSGRVLARFPDSATPGGVHALAQPRGLGRGALTKSQVIWPVEGRLLVFPINVKNVSNGPSAGLAVKAKACADDRTGKCTRRRWQCTRTSGSRHRHNSQPCAGLRW